MRLLVAAIGSFYGALRQAWPLLRRGYVLEEIKITLKPRKEAQCPENVIPFHHHYHQHEGDIA